MTRLLAIAVKDMTLITRDRTALLIMLVMPLAMIFILGSALGSLGEGDSLDIDVAIVNEDEGETGQLFVDGLTSSEHVDRVFNVDVREDSAAVRADVERGDLAAALIIPADLTAKIGAGTPVGLEVLQDPGSTLTSGIWVGVVRAAVANASAQIIAGRVRSAYPVSAGPPPAAQGAEYAAPPSMDELTFDAVTVREIEAETAKTISRISYYGAGMTGMFLLFGSMFGAFSFVKERREQTLARLLSTPASRAAIVGGKSIAVLAVAVAQFLVLLVGTRVLFRVDWGEHVGAAVLVGIAEALAAAGMAMTLAALGKSERTIGGIAPAMIIFFAATGGSMIPLEQLPTWLRPLQSVSPVYWSVSGLLDVMGGAGLADVLPNIAALLAIAVVLFGFGVWRLRYE